MSRFHILSGAERITISKNKKLIIYGSPIKIISYESNNVDQLISNTFSQKQKKKNQINLNDILFESI
jgi:hypothetical protein